MLHRVTQCNQLYCHYVPPHDTVSSQLPSHFRTSLLTFFQQVLKIVGKAAPDGFIQLVESIAHDHYQDLLVDCTRAYHFGARYNVEMEVVLPADMTVAKSHDIALDLQHKVGTALQLTHLSCVCCVTDPPSAATCLCCFGTLSCRVLNNLNAFVEYGVWGTSPA